MTSVSLNSAGAVRAVNRVKGLHEGGSVAWTDTALLAQAEAAILRYLAVAHFGRGRGDWAAGEAPPHWRALVAQVLAPRRPRLSAALQARGPETAPALAAAVQSLLADAVREVLVRLHPAAGQPVHNPRP